MTLSGLASTVDVDLTRQKFRGWAFDNLCLLLKGYPRPPLLFKHRPDQVAGIIRHLGYDDRGQLQISADVDHPLARRCNAFSVCATVLQYEIRNADCADYFALIAKAHIDEISLVNQPANLNAIVRSRHSIAPVAPFLKTLGEQADLSIKAVRLIERKLELLQLIAQSPAPALPPPARQPLRRAAPAHIIQKPRTEFAKLVSELNSRE
ncbi:hypothetical protein JEY40_31720 [Bradyrhizobium japonicum]|uniref:hypothetical protein n=1 Tax=Bradyrhizobium japonicum TaxID=375 RepID=UPI002010C342|nr:hypothetical protein [Bradyrhizobium japonicum]UQD70493.1 hypothetical protein JEY40_31720 [Bradyrhizobium japonicum]